MATYILEIKGQGKNIHIEDTRLPHGFWSSIADFSSDCHVRVTKKSFFGLREDVIFEQKPEKNTKEEKRKMGKNNV